MYFSLVFAELYHFQPNILPKATQTDGQIIQNSENVCRKQILLMEVSLKIFGFRRIVIFIVSFRHGISLRNRYIFRI